MRLCAGGLETTIQGEEIIESNWDGTSSTSLGRRKQKLYQDILGRTWKSEVFNWNNTVYSTNETTFNGLDQPLTVTKTEASTSVSQVTTMTYDGHGRLKTQHLPQQDANAVTTYNYNPDDSVESVMDARGAKMRYFRTAHCRGCSDPLQLTNDGGSLQSPDVTDNQKNLDLGAREIVKRVYSLILLSRKVSSIRS